MARLLVLLAWVAGAGGARAESDPAAAAPVAASAPAPAPAPGSDARAAAAGQADARASGVDAKEELDFGWALAQTLLVLGMVIMLAWLTLSVGLRRLLGIRPAAGTRLVSVLEQVPLDQKRALFVVEAAGEVLLLGGGDAGLSLLAKLDKPTVDRMRAEQAAAAPVLWSPFVRKLIGRKDAPPPPAA